MKGHGGNKPVSNQTPHKCLTCASNMPRTDQNQSSKINSIVTKIEFFAPTTQEQANAQQTKLFFLLILSLSDNSLDKDGRESILTNLGLYDDLSDPKQLAGSVSKNGVQYILEPLVENGFLFGLSLYSSFTDKSGSN